MPAVMPTAAARHPAPPSRARIAGPVTSIVRLGHRSIRHRKTTPRPMPDAADRHSSVHQRAPGSRGAGQDGAQLSARSRGIAVAPVCYDAAVVDVLTELGLFGDVVRRTSEVRGIT